MSDNQQTKHDNASTPDDTEDLQWFDEDYICKVLSSHEGQSVTLLDHQVVKATSKGENYVSAMHRVTATYQVQGSEDVKTLPMIVKSRLDSELIAQIEEDFNVFERESQTYRVIMKSSEDLLQTIGDETLFGPRAYYVDKKIIVQEDLRQRAYSIHDVKNGLSFEHCRRVLEKLAKFHATTRVLYDQDPDMFRYHLNGNVSTDSNSLLNQFYTNAIESCVDYVKTVPDLECYAEKVEEFGKTIIQSMCNVFKRNNGEFHVLTHGDAWVNNFMYKEDFDGNIIDVLFVDYQEGFYGSLGIDFNYFIYSSWTEDVYLNQMDNLIEGYHKVLADTLTKLNYKKDIPTLNDIRNEIFSKINHGIVTATCLKPVLINEHLEYADPEIFIADSEESKKARAIVFNNPKFGDFLKVALKDFVNLGVL